MIAAFDRSVVAAVGIDDYANGIPRLHNARGDAAELAGRLEERGYTARRLLDGATRERLLSFLDGLVDELQADDRLVFYFAGHGRAPDSSLGQPGCLLTVDADPLGEDAGLVTMDEVKARLDALRCRHLLVILDCCYAGSFRWASATRHGEILPSKPFREHYLRYTESRARQVLTSSAHDQKAHDALWGLGHRASGDHSPFAQALFDALDGAADLVPEDGNGLITATELFAYLRYWVQDRTAGAGRLQTPGFWSLDGHGSGEFVFEVPGREVDLMAAPELTAALNPYLGLEAFTCDHMGLFFGRSGLVDRVAGLLSDQPLIALVGGSGSGKSSLLQAGVLPRLQGLGRRRPGRPLPAVGDPWRVVGPLRPGEDPLAALASAFAAAFEGVGAGPDGRRPQAVLDWLEQHPGERLVVAVDQLEELITLASEAGRAAFEELVAGWVAAAHRRLRVIVTLRVDMEAGIEGTEERPRPLREHWRRGRLVVPAMDHVELRQVIAGPAGQRALFVEEALVRELIKDVQQMPGALSLLSVALSELYQAHVKSRRRDRRLALSDYETSGRVGGSISRRANAVVEGLVASRSAAEAAALRQTLRRVMLRMVSLRGQVSARRRVSRAELVYSDENENRRVRELLEALEKERLVVPSGDSVEPAHDMLINGWDELQEWIEDEAVREDVLLQQRVAEESLAWAGGHAGTWWDDPRLLRLRIAPQHTVPWWRRPRGARWQPKTWLSRRERVFFEASLRQRRRRLGIRWTVGVLALGLIAGLGLVYSERQLAQRETRSRRLASQSADVVADQPDLALLLAVEGWKTAENPESRGALLAGLQAHPRLITQLAGSEGAINQLRLGPRGEILASVDGGGVKLWNLGSRDLMESLPGAEKGLVAVDFSHDGRWFAAAGTGGVTLWKLADLKQPPRQLQVEGASTLAFAWSSDTVAVGTSAGEVELIRLGDGSRRRMQPGHRGSVTRVVFAPNREWLISAAMESEAPVRVWDLAQGTESPTTLELPPRTGPARWIGGANDVDVSDDGRLVAAAREDGGVAVWELASSSLVLSRRVAGSDTALGVELLAGSTHLVSSHSNGEILLWSLSHKDNEPDRFLAHRGGAYSVDSRGPASQLFSGGADSRVRRWHLFRSNPLATELWRGEVKVRQIGWIGPDGDGFLGLSDGKLHSWRSSPSTEARRPVSLESARAVAVSPSGRQVLLERSGGERHELLEIWALRGDRRSLLALPPSFPWPDETTSPFRVASFSPRGKYLALVHWQGVSRILLWETATPSNPPLELETGNGLVAELVFDRQESRLLSISYGQSFTLWKTATGKRMTDPQIESAVSTAVFGPQGERLFLGQWNGNIEARSVSDPGHVVASADKHTESVQVLEVDPEGRFLVSADSDGQILLWDAASLSLIGALRAPEGHFVEDMAFDSTGKILMTAGFGIYRWNLDVESWIDLATERANRSLTPEEAEQFLSPGN